MKGRSLSVIALAFKKKYMDFIPDRAALETVFSEFKLAASTQDINDEMLLSIKSKFKQNLVVV